LSERNTLLAEIAGLDSELDQVYHQMARGDGGPRKDKTGAVGSGLTDLLSRTRDLKEQLRKAHARLGRLDRDAAMNLRFLQSLTSKPGSPSETQPDIGKIAPPRKRYDFDEEDSEFEFESLLDRDL
jgi:hypothetical protein